MKLSSVIGIGIAFLLNSLVAAQNANTAIEGKLMLDGSWQRTIYLSYIPSLSDMYTISPELIITKSEIDSTGSFHFSTALFPEEEGLYRLHVPKLESPSSSLIIGGRQENHFFLVARKDSYVLLSDTGTKSLFKDVDVNHSKETQWLQKIDKISSYRDSAQFGASKMNREFLSIGVNEKLRNIADTLQYPIPSLYAIYKSDYYAHSKDNPAFYTQFLNKQKLKNSPYSETFEKELAITPTSVWTEYLWLFLAFIFGWALHYVYRQKNGARNTKKLKLLSVQERKIFELMKAGHSNKEISEAHNIGVSTVKSHVNKIYSKLSIKSRKEAMDF